MAVSDEALLAGMASGDADAAAAFVRRFQARVFGLAVSIVTVPAVAEDVAQDAFVRAWRYAGSFDPRRGRATGWLLTITRNLAIDALRLRREIPFDTDVLLGTLAADPDEPTVGADDVERIRAALRGLPASQARAVVLSAYCGLTAREIADRDAIPLGTAKTRIRAGLAQLRATMEEVDD